MTSIEQVLLSNDDIEVVVLPSLGARLHSLRVRGRELLRSPNEVGEHERDPFFWGAYVMAPWCNRVAASPTPVGEAVIDLPANFPDGSAIHGQVYAAAWERAGDGSFAIEREGAGWPWAYRVELALSLGERALTIGQRLVNLGATPMPGGIGIHPWFPGRVRVAINSALVYPSNSAAPSHPQPVTGLLDLRQPSELAAGVDATWAEPADPPVQLWWPDHGLHAVMHVASDTPHITAANAVERGAIAVEPQTHAPQGLRRLIQGEPGAMAMVAPGRSLDLTTTLAFDWSD